VKAALILLAACGSGAAPLQAPVPPPATWPTPAGWKRETIPFPLEFAPLVLHRGVEELRFAPGMFEPGTPGYWSYTFVWRTEDPAAMDATALASELTGYFRGLIAAVDQDNRITARDEIVVKVTGAGPRLALTAHVFDAFKTAQPVDLVGWAQRTACGEGALWVFVIAPEHSGVRGQLDTLAASAACGQH
jgi:hypothetical protein